MPFLPGFSDTPSMLRFLAIRNQRAWEGLAELYGGTDYKTKVQASVMVTASNILIHLPQTAVLCIRKTCEFIRVGDLRFVPAYGRPPEFSEDLHETLVPLSQTVYWENYLFLMYGGSEPQGTAELEKEFRRDLPVSGITSTLCTFN